MWFKQAYERFLLQYYTLQHFQHFVDHYRVHYDRHRFRRINENIGRYHLTQFRALQTKPLETLIYPLEIEHQPPHIRWHKYFYLFFALRCALVAFFPFATQTENARVLLGTEFIKGQSFFFDTPFLLWSLIGYLHLQFSLTKSLLDYKFLAIWRISPNKPHYLRAADLGLTENELVRLHHYRQLAKGLMHNGTGSISTLGPLSVVMLFLVGSLYSRHFWLSLLWTITMSYWTFAISSLINSNLVQFLVIVKYLHIKQRSIIQSMNGCLQQIGHIQKQRGNFRRMIWSAQLVECSARYSHLQDEIADYNRFWRIYLSLIFLFYVLLIGLMLNIFFYSNIIPLVLFTFGVIFIMDVIILSTLIYICGKMVKQSRDFSTLFTSILARFSCQNKNKCFSTRFNLKINNIDVTLDHIKSGFSLLNNYVLEYSTFRLLTVNIIIYFLLISKN